MTHSFLSIHRRIHTGDNPHHCKLCDNWSSFEINLIQIPFIYACILEGRFVIVPIHNLYPFHFSCVFWWWDHCYWNQWRWTNNWFFIGCVIFTCNTFSYIVQHLAGSSKVWACWVSLVLFWMLELELADMPTNWSNQSNWVKLLTYQSRSVQLRRAETAHKTMPCYGDRSGQYT